MSTKVGTIPSKNLYICGLSILHTKENLQALFETYGSIQNVVLKQRMQNQSSLIRFGFVRFKLIEDAVVAKNIQDRKMSFGRQMR
jgi:RNA recognition motif-containing protein